jgi:hypothetical protein
VTEVSIEELAKILKQHSEYVISESAPQGFRPPAIGLGFDFSLEELRDVVISAQYKTAGQEVAQEVAQDVMGYPYELYAAFKGWAGNQKITFDSETDKVRLS